MARAGRQPQTDKSMTTETVSQERHAKTRRKAQKLRAEFLQRLADVTQVTASESIGVDDSTVNRWTNDDRFFQFFQLLAACELKIADVNDMLIDKEMQKAFPATMRMAANWMEGQLGGYGDGE